MPDHKFESDDLVAEICFRFDFVIEADVTGAFALLEAHQRDKPAAVAAIKRRGDMALRPSCYTLWLDRQLDRVVDPRLIENLERPYDMETDFDLNPARWRELLQLGVPELAHWAEMCLKARSVADSALRADCDFADFLANAERRAMRVDHGRLGQLLARARSSQDPEELAELAFEERLALALRHGIRFPKVRVDTIGAVFISRSHSTTNRFASLI